MKVILLKDVSKLGRRYDVKEVKSGYALNLLIPQKLAVAATAEALKRNEILKAQVEGEKKVHEDLLVMNIKGLEGITLNISGKANEKGHLFAGLHREAVAAEIFKQTQLQVDPSFIQLEHPLKEVGEYEIEVKSPDFTEGVGNKAVTKKGKSVKFKVVIVGE